MLFFRLLPRIQRGLERQNFDTWQPRAVAAAAERLWETTGQDRQDRQDRSDRGASSGPSASTAREEPGEPAPKRTRSTTGTYDKYGKSGHKEADCWSEIRY